MCEYAGIETDNEMACKLIAALAVTHGTIFRSFNLLSPVCAQGGAALGNTRTGRRLWVTSDKTHIEHNETALIQIVDMPRDMDFCCNGR
jgi:hypothetical protein